eukprot:4620459-Prymnesium_polylepis.1
MLGLDFDCDKGEAAAARPTARSCAVQGRRNALQRCASDMRCVGVALNDDASWGTLKAAHAWVSAGEEDRVAKCQSIVRQHALALMNSDKRCNGTLAAMWAESRCSHASGVVQSFQAACAATVQTAATRRPAGKLRGAGAQRTDAPVLLTYMTGSISQDDLLARVTGGHRRGVPAWVRRLVNVAPAGALWDDEPIGDRLMKKPRALL